jgi:hypothetical protein
MVTKVRAAIFGAAVFTAGMVSAIPAASASPVSSEATESSESAVADSGEELRYYWSYWTRDECVNDGWAGVNAQLWYADFICVYNGSYWELWINPVFLCC